MNRANFACEELAVGLLLYAVVNYRDCLNDATNGVLSEDEFFVAVAKILAFITSAFIENTDNLSTVENMSKNKELSEFVVNQAVRFLDRFDAEYENAVDKL